MTIILMGVPYLYLLTHIFPTNITKCMYCKHFLFMLIMSVIPSQTLLASNGTRQPVLYHNFVFNMVPEGFYAITLKEEMFHKI
jgi:hypothetical protein